MKLPSTLAAFGAVTPLVFSSMATAQTNHALELDGSGDYVLVGGAGGMDGITAFTVEAWIRPTGEGQLAGIGCDPSLGCGNYRWEVGFACAGPGKSTVSTNAEQDGAPNADVFVPALMCDGAWHHLALVDDGMTHALWIDGALAADTPSSGLTWNMNGRPIRIGCHPSGIKDWFPGLIDDFRIWRRALTPAEIAGTVQGLLVADPTDLVSWWDFESGAADVQGQNDGVLVADAKTVPALIDCDGDGISDADELAQGAPDCNGNGIPDDCDVASGVSLDQDGNAVPDECVPAPLATDLAEVSVAAGGQQTLLLTADASLGLQIYFVLGSASGTQPGVTLDGLHLPLQVFDPYFLASVSQPNQEPFVNTVSLLSPSGTASASIVVPPGLPGLAGLTLHHAYVVFADDLAVAFASNAVSLALLP